jgi:hypothetical protein
MAARGAHATDKMSVPKEDVHTTENKNIFFQRRTKEQKKNTTAEKIVFLIMRISADAQYNKKKK